VPAPATLELLKGCPSYASDIRLELTTPTGAAIVTTLATRFGTLPMIRVEKVGYGAGTKDLPSAPNLLRLIVGAVEEHGGAEPTSAPHQHHHHHH
jgi:pyridinium-3,5-bisthiocarboxylic acid mononucleotide nickel chelatase